MCKEHVERLVEPYPEEWKDRVREQLFIAIESEGTAYSPGGKDINETLTWTTTPQNWDFWNEVCYGTCERAFAILVEE